MASSRARINRRIIILLGISFAAVALLALWGVSQPNQPPTQTHASVADPPPFMTEAQAKAEVRRLLADLDSFKALEGFHSGAFSSKGLPQAVRWHQTATALQTRISNDTALPAVLRAAPGNLIGLALAYRESRGEETQGTKSDREMIEDALR
jgi:hypothetical protein